MVSPCSWRSRRLAFLHLKRGRIADILLIVSHRVDLSSVLHLEEAGWRGYRRMRGLTWQLYGSVRWTSHVMVDCGGVSLSSFHMLIGSPPHHLALSSTNATQHITILSSSRSKPTVSDGTAKSQIITTHHNMIST